MVPFWLPTDSQCATVACLAASSHPYSVVQGKDFDFPAAKPCTTAYRNYNPKDYLEILAKKVHINGKIFEQHTSILLTIHIEYGNVRAQTAKDRLRHA